MSRWYVRSADRRPDPAPMQVDSRPLVRAMLGLWTVLLVAALLLHDRLEESGRGWWVWTAVAGIALGLWGWRWLTRARPPDDAPRDDVAGPS